MSQTELGMNVSVWEVGRPESPSHLGCRRGVREKGLADDASLCSEMPLDLARSVSSCFEAMFLGGARGFF